MLPALANKVTPDKVHIPITLTHLFDVNWLYGFFASCVLYYGLNIAFPRHEAIIPAVIYGLPEIDDGVSKDGKMDDASSNAEKGAATMGLVEGLLEVPVVKAI